MSDGGFNAKSARRAGFLQKAAEVGKGIGKQSVIGGGAYYFHVIDKGGVVWGRINDLGRASN
jgi:hypothetical protein